MMPERIASAAHRLINIQIVLRTKSGLTSCAVQMSEPTKSARNTRRYSKPTCNWNSNSSKSKARSRLVTTKSFVSASFIKAAKT